MPAGSNAKRERQYEHIKEGAEKRGASKGRAKELASRAQGHDDSGRRRSVEDVVDFDRRLFE